MPPLDDTLRLLANEQRRDLLRSLSDGSCRVMVETDDSAACVSLHHVHLPKLAEADIVDFHRTRGVAERGPAFDEVLPLLEAIDAVADGAVGRPE